MNNLIFGTAGVPISSKNNSTEAGIERIRELNLDCMELEFVRGVKMGIEKARNIKKIAEKNNVLLTVHAPYWINLNSKEKEKIENSIRFIFESSRIGFYCGARDICFHPAYYHNDSPSLVYKTVKKNIIYVRKLLEREKIDVYLRPETTGKPAQFGSLSEILSLAQEIEKVEPAIDFAHLYARGGGKPNNFEEFCDVLERYKKSLGKESLKRMQIHISGIDFGEKGEKKHLPFEKSSFNYKDCLKALREYKVEGFLICESPILEKDALVLKREYYSTLSNK